MIERNRAWRRRKARVILSKLKKTTDWIAHQFNDKTLKKPISRLKQHQHGKLTQAQSLRLLTGLNEEIHDRAWQSAA